MGWLATDRQMSKQAVAWVLADRRVKQVPVIFVTGSILVKVQKILRNAVAGVLVASMPISASFAATRPNAAVPMASSAATTAAVQDDGYGGGTPWLALGAVALAIIVGIWILADGNGNGDGALSRG